MTDTEWLADQQRRRNLASYQHQPKPVRPVREFTESQLRIARADYERRRKTQ